MSGCASDCKCRTCVQAVADAALDDRVASVLRAYHKLEGSMTRHLSDDGAIVSARASALSLAYDLVRERDPRLW